MAKKGKGCYYIERHLFDISIGRKPSKQTTAPAIQAPKECLFFFVNLSQPTISLTAKRKISFIFS